MYERSRRYYRSRRKREEIKGYLQTLLWVLTVICIVTVCLAMALQTRKVSKVVAAETITLEASGLIDEGRMIDIAQAVTTKQKTVMTDAAKHARAEAERVIVIDPGHGGMDGGCTFDQTVEKEINRLIAYRVAEKLRNMGYKVELARKGDNYVDKLERVESANRQNALLYVSIHQNSCEDHSVAGIETWYDTNDTSGEDKRLAQLIQQETVKASGAAGRELVADSELCVTGKTSMPACLIETGFLSNKKEREKLNTEEYREQIAEGIASGIDLFLNPKTMYLTFDDGPSEEYTDLVLDELGKRNIKATFFVIGEYVRKYPETAKRIAREGHTIGIHCDVHDYQKLYADADSYIDDFQRAYDTVYEVTGVKAQFFRFPGGSVNAFNKNVYRDIIEKMEKKGFVYYDWNASMEDATREDATSEELIRTAVDTTLGRRHVVMLAHDRVDRTAYALGDLIEALPEYRMEPLTAETEPVQF
ncbi:MAG: polysaccharide deacetylase family protein [Lachnospiraceae bacterium]|nr:polysaccharide deacetylase family protein [Lachnospiraceae bacterium]